MRLQYNRSILRRQVWILLPSILLLPLCAAPLFAQKSKPVDASLPKYDSHTESKTKGTIDDIQLLQVGTRKDITELTVKSGEDIIHVFLGPKTFQEEMGVSFTKGDEIAVTGSKVKREGAEITLAREVVKGNDTLILRDEKGDPVWNWRTGK